MDHGCEPCFVCNGPVPDYIPEYCCNGYECGCQGMPVEPPICSGRCENFLFQIPAARKKDGTYETLEEKKKTWGFKDWKPNQIKFIMED